MSGAGATTATTATRGRAALCVGSDIPAEILLAAGLEPTYVSCDEGVEAAMGAEPRPQLVVFSQERAAYAIAHSRVFEWRRRAAANASSLPRLAVLALPNRESDATREFAHRRLRSFIETIGSLSGQRVTTESLAAAVAARGRELEPAGPAVTAAGTNVVYLIGTRAATHAATPDLERLGFRVVMESVPPVELSSERPANLGVVIGQFVDRHFEQARRGVRADSESRARLLLAEAHSFGADLVLHIVDHDDAAEAWFGAVLDRVARRGAWPAAVRRAAATDPAAAAAAWLDGTVDSERPWPDSWTLRSWTEDGATRPNRPSRKVLDVTSSFTAYQHEWFGSVLERVRSGETFAVLNADAPQEIFRAMDIPFVINQWWSSLVAAKQLTGRFLETLDNHGYPSRFEPYNSSGLASHLHDAPEPWGGLPTPDILGYVHGEDAVAPIFEEWAVHTGSTLLRFDRTVESRDAFATDWWSRLPHEWNSMLETDRLDLFEAQLRASVSELEALTGRTFSAGRFRAVFDLVNEQEEYFRKTRDLIAATRPAPVSIVDTMPATMIPQWHRGTEWGRDAAKAVYEAVAERAAEGAAACPHERIRLMWAGRGLWQSMGAYQAFEESHGAVFVWSMYLGLAADGYLRYVAPGDDPLRALAARFVTMGDELRMPTWSSAWHVAEAERHHVDAVVAIDDADPLVLDALDTAGYPVLRLANDNIVPGAGAALEEALEAFLDEHFGRRLGSSR